MLKTRNIFCSYVSRCVLVSSEFGRLGILSAHETDGDCCDGLLLVSFSNCHIRERLLILPPVLSVIWVLGSCESLILIDIFACLEQLFLRGLQCVASDTDSTSVWSAEWVWIGLQNEFVFIVFRLSIVVVWMWRIVQSWWWWRVWTSLPWTRWATESAGQIWAPHGRGSILAYLLLTFIFWCDEVNWGN